MRIVCDHCHTEYEVDPPAAPYARPGKNLMFRCNACGRTISTTFETDAGEADSPVDVAETDAPTGMLLKQDGKVYHVRDLATMQRWVVERRLSPGDLVSAAGGDWAPVGQMQELRAFFEIVGQADSALAQAATRPAAVAVPRSSDHRSVPEFSDAASLSGSEFEVTEIEGDRDSDSSDLIGEGSPGMVSDLGDWEAPVDGATEPMFSRDDSGLGPDEPTVDLGLEAEDFFSEEHFSGDDPTERVESPDFQVVEGMVDYGPDDGLEWVRQRNRRRLAIFVGLLAVVGLGGWWFTEHPIDIGGDEVAANVVAAPVPPQAPAARAAAAPTAKAPAADAATAPSDIANTPEDKATAPPTADKTEATATATAAADKVEAPKKAAPRENHRALVDAGWNDLDKGRLDSARAKFQRALKAKPGSGEARFGLAYVTEKKGQTDKAVQQYCRIIKKSSKRNGTVREVEGRLKALRKDCR